jgi:HSP20 family protein
MLTPIIKGVGREDLGMEVETRDDEYIVRANVPEMRPTDLQVDVEGNTLRIHGQVEEERREEGDVVVYERNVAQFSRTVSLPSNVDAQRAVAAVENGMLTLHLPRTDVARPGVILITSGQS